MKKYLLLSIFLSCFTVFAITPMGGDADFEATGDMTHVPAMIQVLDQDVEETIADLEKIGVTILRHRSNIILAYIPVELYLSGLEADEDENQEGDSGDNTNDSNGRKLKKAKGIKRIEYSKPRKNKPQLHLARNFNDAYYINEGAGLPQPFTGKGVVVGVCDIGMDTRHPTFLSADDPSDCRIRKVVHYRELQGERTEYNSPEEIYEWQTDNPDDWHATHVTGIAAGAGYETLSGAKYHSLAYDADIVFTASQLSDVGLLAGVEDIIDYAKEVEKPAVINLSMGNSLGPHDGTSLFTKYLDLCAEDAIICISAGNDGEGGNVSYSMSYDFKENKNFVEVRPNDWGGTDYTGAAEIWSSDKTPFLFSYYWRNDTRYEDNKYPYDALLFDDSAEIKQWRISADKDDPDYDKTFGELCTSGYIVATGGISPLNGRYYVSLEFKATSEIYHDDAKWGEWWPGIKVVGVPGSHVDIFCGGGSFLRPERNNPPPDNKLCISDLATGFKTISVGSMNNTSLNDKEDPGYGWRKGEVSYFSSYGKLSDNRVFPMTVAPGAYVVSSTNSAFLEKYKEELQYTDDESDYNGEKVYWIGTLGTSMSCPFVVSAIATWVQAFPQLTWDYAQKIIQDTNVKSGYPEESDPRHGQGWFSAYKGLQKVVDLAGALKVGTLEAPEALIKVENGMVVFANPTGRDLIISVYTPAGMLVDNLSLSSSLGSYSLDHLPRGIYLVRATSFDGGTQTLKIKL